MSLNGLEDGPEGKHLLWCCSDIADHADAEKLALLPTGSTCNEAFHKDVNTRFRSMPAVHLPTLSLQLRAFQLASLLKFRSAASCPTLRQVRPRGVPLGRSPAGCYGEFWTSLYDVIRDHRQDPGRLQLCVDIQIPFFLRGMW